MFREDKWKMEIFLGGELGDGEGVMGIERQSFECEIIEEWSLKLDKVFKEHFRTEFQTVQRNMLILIKIQILESCLKKITSTSKGTMLISFLLKYGYESV